MMVRGGRHIFLGNFLMDGEGWETYIFRKLFNGW